MCPGSIAIALRYAASASSGRPQDHAEVAVGVGVPGIDRDRPAVGADGRLQPAAGLRGDPEVVVVVRAIGLEREALLDERDGLVAAPVLVREHAGGLTANENDKSGVELSFVQHPARPS
jgi:hypothetical protein